MIKGYLVGCVFNVILGIKNLSPAFGPVIIFAVIIYLPIFSMISLVPLHAPQTGDKFRNNMTGTFSFNFNACTGKPAIFIPFKNSSL